MNWFYNKIVCPKNKCKWWGIDSEECESEEFCLRDEELLDDYFEPVDKECVHPIITGGDDRAFTTATCNKCREVIYKKEPLPKLPDKLEKYDDVVLPTDIYGEKINEILEYLKYKEV